MSHSVKPVKPVLEPAAAAFAEATAKPPYLFDLAPAEGRKAVDEVQSGEIAKPDVDEEWIIVTGRPDRQVRARIVRPRGATARCRSILYIHGAGWVFGNAHTHDRLVRELAVGAGAAVVFPEYDLSPEARYPVAIEQNYAVAQWVVRAGADKGLDGTRHRGRRRLGRRQHDGRADADGQGARRRRRSSQQVLFYPVTDANFDTGSYHQFAEGYFLRRDAMQWFWDQYTTDAGAAREITASPLRATLDAARRPAAGARDHRRSRRPARRGRGVREQAPRGRRAGHRRAVPGHHPRLRDAQRAARDPRRRGRHRAGRRAPCATHCTQTDEPRTEHGPPPSPARCSWPWRGVGHRCRVHRGGLGGHMDDEAIVRARGRSVLGAPPRTCPLRRESGQVQPPARSRPRPMRSRSPSADHGSRPRPRRGVRREKTAVGITTVVGATHQGPVPGNARIFLKNVGTVLRMDYRPIERKTASSAVYERQRRPSGVECSFWRTPEVLSAIELGDGFRTTGRLGQYGQDRPVILRVAPEPSATGASGPRVDAQRVRQCAVSNAGGWPAAHFWQSTSLVIGQRLPVSNASRRDTARPPRSTPTLDGSHCVLQRSRRYHPHDPPSTRARLQPGSRPTHERWSDALFCWFDRAADLSRNGLETDDIAKLIEVADRNRALLSEITEPRMLHGDLWVGNTMLALDAPEPTITGVYDSGPAWWVPEADWPIYWRCANRAVGDTLWEGYGQVGQTERARWRALVYEAKHATALLLEYKRLACTKEFGKCLAKSRYSSPGWPNGLRPPNILIMSDSLWVVGAVRMPRDFRERRRWSHHGFGTAWPRKS